MEKLKMVSLVLVLAASALSGCSLKPIKPICTADYRMAGAEYTVNIYGVQKVGGQTMLKAGHPFNFRYVSVTNFTSNTCH